MVHGASRELETYQSDGDSAKSGLWGSHNDVQSLRTYALGYEASKMTAHGQRSHRIQ